jgi:corrinoid protein of di/trimethylamine methyltransferase
MNPNEPVILKELADAVVAMDAVRARRGASLALDAGISALVAINEGLSKGMDRVNELFEQEEYFVPEILVCADAMTAGIDVLRPHLPRDAGREDAGRVVIGVVKGDTHDIGKNLVRIMLENAGFAVHDLGRDVPHAKFVDTAGAIGADLVCLSTLMTSTMDGMGVVVEHLREARIASKVLVGGGPISAAFAKRIGADGHGRNAAEAVKVARSLVQVSVLP